MDRFSLTNKKSMAVLAGLAIMAFISGIIKNQIPHFDNLSAIFYCVLFVAWGLMAKRRIMDPRIRKNLIRISGLMIFLFMLRVARFNFFDEVPFMSDILWYAYYIPMTAIPFCSILVAIYTEPVKRPELVGIYEKALTICEIIIILVVMTNRFHGLVFKIYNLEENDYSRNWFYYIVLSWMIILIVGTLAILLRKCSLSSVKKMWYVPVLCLFAGFALLIWYLVAGGAPVINGVKIFHLQEAYCFPFLTVFESAIQIRLIPANTGYELLFDYSGIDAAICDADGRAILTSKNWEADAGDDDHQIRKESISGGYVTWVQDMTAINKLNADIEEVTEELEEENDLIRQENEIRAERVSFETKNRLYNNIARAVRPKAIIVNSILEKNADEISRAEFIYAAFLSAYIKRMGNLLLITDESKKVSTSELVMAIRETMDYMELNDIACEIIEKEVKELPASFIIFAYDLFEQLVEDAWNSLHSCVIIFEKDKDYKITIAIDSPQCSTTHNFRERELAQNGISLAIRNEDDTFYITTTCSTRDDTGFSDDKEVGA